MTLKATLTQIQISLYKQTENPTFHTSLQKSSANRLRFIPNPFPMTGQHLQSSLRRKRKKADIHEGESTRKHQRTWSLSSGSSQTSDASQTSISSYTTSSSTHSSTSSSNSLHSLIPSPRNKNSLLHQQETIVDGKYSLPLRTLPHFALQQAVSQHSHSPPPSPTPSQTKSSYARLSAQELMPHKPSKPPAPRPLRYPHAPLFRAQGLTPTEANTLYKSWTYPWRYEQRRRAVNGMEWMYDAEYDAGDFVMDPRW